MNPLYSTTPRRNAMRKTRRAALFVGLLLLAATVAGVAEAAGTAQTNGPESNLSFLFAVFAVTWAAFFAYVFYMAYRGRELRREVEALRQALEEKEASKQE